MPVHTHRGGRGEERRRRKGRNVISVSLPRSTAAFELAHLSRKGLEHKGGRDVCK